ncbi:hypothetical protein [Bradyrhizobium sp. HKCCYLRH1030]|uniref:hypothetical protein n=1 Tax=Bradyrhizobium sp. HKCCYLRH1030 TaxID=3420744 RepID=UPI003EB74361
MSWNQPQVIAARQDILQAARDVLSGAVSPIEGARSIARLRFTALLETDVDILPLVGIDSETDALPLGRDREHWQAQALIDLQGAIDDAQRWARDVADSRCRSLLARSDSLLRWPG